MNDLLKDNLLWQLLRAVLVGLALGAILGPREARTADWGTERWTASDTVRQGALVGLQVVDWRQTRWFVKHPAYYDCTAARCEAGSYRERNPVLGAHPSVGKVNNLIGASIVGHALVSAALPRAWREGWQYTWIGAEAYSVGGNYRLLGIKAVF